MKVNCDAVVHLAQQCQLCSSLLIQFSTDYVFDGKKKRAYTEQDTPAPLNHYGLSKLAAEQQITQYCEKYLILRTSWLFSEFGHNFYRTILNLAQSAQQISVIDDQFGSPTYAGDVAKAVIDIVRQYQHQHYLPYGVYHLSSGPAVSWYHFAQAIFAAKQIDVTLKPITTQQWLAAAVRPTNSALNSNKIQTALGLVVPDWHNALAKLVRGHA
jgi:dTDP-4-dehydrorhamnose reductase